MTVTASPRIPDPEETPILSVPDAGRLAFGLGRAASYQAAARGELPTLRSGKRLVVPTAALRQLLGLPVNAGGDRAA